MNIERITVCGGGNGAHALLPILLETKNIELNLYLPIEQEYGAFRAFKDTGAPFLLDFAGKKREVSFRAVTITSDPARAADADIIFIVTPAFAHGDILHALATYLCPGTIVAALPARGGFEYQAHAVLKEYDKKGIVIAGFQTLPWACRTGTYAASVEVYGRKSLVGFSSLPCMRNTNAAEAIAELLGVKLVAYNNMLELTLNNQGQIIHPGIMCGLFSGREEKRFSAEEIPFFYKSIDDDTAALLENMSDEIQKVKTMLTLQYGVDLSAVIPIAQWMLNSYGKDFQGARTLAQMFQENPSYKTLKAPVRQADGLFAIDVSSRYITEDVPFGLIVSKAIALLAGVETPKIDMVIGCAEGWMKAEYIKNGTLTGKDIKKTRIPQNYGFTDLQSIINLNKRS